MKIPLFVARNLLRMLNDEEIPFSSLNHASIKSFFDDEIIAIHRVGRTKGKALIKKKNNFRNYLKNKYGINDLELYIVTLEEDSSTRADLIESASDSKLKCIKPLKGFFINSFEPLNYKILGQLYELNPICGTSIFIHQPDWFEVPEDIVVVGVENSENFSKLSSMTYLFKKSKYLFVLRYQSSAFRNWLIRIPNQYIHFGDYDISGLLIYIREFKRYLGSRANLFVPDNLEELLSKYGNRDLFTNQFGLLNSPDFDFCPDISTIIEMISKYQKGLEQEIFLNLDK